MLPVAGPQTGFCSVVCLGRSWESTVSRAQGLLKFWRSKVAAILHSQSDLYCLQKKISTNSTTTKSPPPPFFLTELYFHWLTVVFFITLTEFISQFSQIKPALRRAFEGIYWLRVTIGQNAVLLNTNVRLHGK